MANQEHFDLLKQGVVVWNQWRQEHPGIQPDLFGATLTEIDLRAANLSEANLIKADLSRVCLNEADLSGSHLRWAIVSNADLSLANLNKALLSQADLIGTDLSGVCLEQADLERANLSRTNLSRGSLAMSNLIGTDLSKADLRETNLRRATLASTIFGDVDLRQVKGLEEVKHVGPSIIGIDTVYRSGGEIPQSFLRKAGVPDSFLEVMASITNRPIEYYTVFISYSSRDQDFAERLYADLQSNHVRCWFAPEDLKIGDKIRPSIDESIRLHDKLLLVLSQHSVASQWVEQEVERALARERKENKVILFPIRLDKTVMDIEEGWPALIRNTRNIGDFTRWKRHDAYQKELERLLRDLKAEAAKPGP